MVYDAPTVAGGMPQSIQLLVGGVSRAYPFSVANTTEEVTKFAVDTGDLLTVGFWMKTSYVLTGNIALYYNYAGAIWNGKIDLINIQPDNEWH